MPLQTPKLTGLKKRQQIENANHVMFIWVAIASVAVSFCAVSAQFLLQKASYNSHVLSAKNKASDTLTQNIQNANALKQNVDALIGNQDLASIKTDPNDPNTKSVLDALPNKLDVTALATSLQKAILSRSGVVIESITVPSPQTSTSSTSTTTATTTAPESSPIEQKFSVTISGTYGQIHGAIVDLERSIRPMKLTSISLNGSDASMRGTIDGVTYYQPTKTVTIKKEVVR